MTLFLQTLGRQACSVRPNGDPGQQGRWVPWDHRTVCDSTGQPMLSHREAPLPAGSGGKPLRLDHPTVLGSVPSWPVRRQFLCFEAHFLAPVPTGSACTSSALKQGMVSKTPGKPSTRLYYILYLPSLVTRHKSHPTGRAQRACKFTTRGCVHWNTRSHPAPSVPTMSVAQSNRLPGFSLFTSSASSV